MDKNLLNILVCPVCKGDLTYDKEAQELICKVDALAYVIKDDIPVMLASEARSLRQVSTKAGDGSADRVSDSE
ncbi:MAG: Trm112 family protein [Gammaproteobacteria bacterium]|nr:Trm112 family protein [Gammaproteobacteria bacterium]